jgi:hypothetical protein
MAVVIDRALRRSGSLPAFAGIDRPHTALALTAGVDAMSTCGRHWLSVSRQCAALP